MIRIDDEKEIYLLNKAVQAAKFSGLPENDELAGDPTLAGLSNRVYDSTDKLQDKKVLDSAALAEIRRIKTSQGYRRQWRNAVITARRDIILSSASKEDRISIAKCYLSPFTCKEGELREFLDEVDGKTGNHDIGKLAAECDLGSAKLLDASYSFAGRQAHVVFRLKDSRICDIYFSDVTEFAFGQGKVGSF